MATLQYSYDRLRFSRTERLPSSFASSELHNIDGPTGECLMATAVSIDSPWHHAREFGQQIVSTLVREFARSQSNSTLIRFEQALKTANHTISQAADKLGVSVHCAVALFIKEEVHFAVIGECKLLLFRGGRLTDVTASDDGSDLRFSSVTSGDLAENEWLMIATPETVRFLRDQDPSTWHEPDLDALAAQLIDQAPAEERSAFFACLLRFRQDGIGQEKSIMWDNLDHVTPIRLPKVSLPQLDMRWFSIALTRVRQLFAGIRQRRSVTAVPMPYEERPESNDYIKTSATPPIWRRIKLPSRSVLLRHRRPLIGVVIAVIVIVIATRTITARVGKNDTATSQPTYIEQLSQVTGAERVRFLASNFSYERYRDLSEADKQSFNQLVTDSGLIPKPLGELVVETPQPIAAIDSLSSTTVALDTTGQLWFIRDKKLAKVEQTVLVQNPKSVAIVREDRIVATDAAGNLWLFDGSTAQPAALTLPASLGTQSKTVTAYAGNLYILTNETKTVWRQTSFDKELASLRNVGTFDSSTVLADWAINGQIIAASTASTLTALQAGKSVASATLPYDATAPRLVTSEAYPDVVVGNGRFMSLYDKKLANRRDFFLPSKMELTDFAVHQPTNSLWVATNTQLFLLAF